MTGRAVVAGGGIIGLSIAWRLARAGLAVSVVDPAPASAASHAAAGMLCPVAEARYGEEAQVALHLAAYDRWPGFAAELEAATGAELGLRHNGTIAVALDADDLRALDAARRFQEELGLEVQRLRSSECRALEPMLSPRVRGGVRVDRESSVDPRRVCAALIGAARAAGVELVEQQVTQVLAGGGRVRGVALEGGDVVAGDHVVLALGPWSAAVAGLPAEAAPPVRPVKGQILRLHFEPASPPVTRNVHGLVHGWSIYLVPRTDGELVIGATVEEKGFDTTVTAGGVRELLDAAVELVPAVAELEQVEALARLRPASADHAPVIGPTSVEGLVLATGHHRNGVLLAPITADAVASLLVDGKLPPEVAPFTIERFRR
ncbi:glycine oxidase ThiO [Rhabdothermincola sp.]|uniref:glycine oxidase ThiO n=1 Tax=Rhabdothermincola sp. TaxID=2820405 RepID=UPI002FE078F4